MKLIQVRVNNYDVFINTDHIVSFSFLESAETVSLKIFTTGADDEYFEITGTQAKAMYKWLKRNSKQLA